MLSPPAALEDAQVQEKEEQGGADEQHNRPGIDDATREVVHLIEDRQRGKEVRGPGGGIGWKLPRQNAEQKQRGAESQRDHRGNRLAARNRRGTTTGRDKQSSDKKDAQERA